MPYRLAAALLLAHALLSAPSAVAQEAGKSVASIEEVRRLLYDGQAENAIDQARAAVKALRPPKNTVILRRIGMYLLEICRAYAQLNRYDEAERACIEAVASFEEAARQDDLPEAYNYELVSIGLPRLAETYTDMGKFAAAISIRQRQLGHVPDGRGYTAERIALLRSIGDLHRSLGEHRNAEAAYLEAIAMIDDLPQDERQDALLTYSSLAGVYQVEERFDKAEAVLLDGLSRLHALSAAESFHVILLSQVLARIYYDGGHLAEAREAAERILEFYKGRGDEDYWFASAAKVLLAQIESAERPDSPEVERLLESAISAAVSDSPTGHAVRAVAKIELALHHLNDGASAKAETLAREASKELDELYGEVSFPAARAKLVVAQILWHHDKPEEALHFAAGAYIGQRQVLPTYHRETGETLALLAVLYEALDRREDLAATQQLIAQHQAARAKFESGR